MHNMWPDNKSREAECETPYHL